MVWQGKPAIVMWFLFKHTWLENDLWSLRFQIPFSNSADKAQDKLAGIKMAEP